MPDRPASLSLLIDRAQSHARRQGAKRQRHLRLPQSDHFSPIPLEAIAINPLLVDLPATSPRFRLSIITTIVVPIPPPKLRFALVALAHVLLFDPLPAASDMAEIKDR